jgi:hypothetical protein
MNQSTLPPGRAGAAPPAGQSAGTHVAVSAASATIVPAVRLATNAPATSLQQLTIEPLLVEGDGSALQVSWSEVMLGQQRTRGCRVSAVAGHTVSLLIEQGPYRKPVTGSGSAEVTAIPLAPAGTRGSLLARDETTGAYARFEWTWLPPSEGKARARVPSTAKRVRDRSVIKGKSEDAQQGNAQTTFFGQAAWGQRFAFVLDVSGSMLGARWNRCIREISQTLEGLIPEREFFVILFSNGTFEPPTQTGWTRAQPEAVKAVIEWLRNYSPDGGTMPRPALERAFALSPKPDALYFLTDGIFSDPTPDEIVRMNGQTSGLLDALRSLFGARSSTTTALYTLALDLAADDSVLKRMAQDSGGSYAQVSSAESAQNG